MDALNHLLTEFFAPGTSAERKRTIEAQLEARQLTLGECQFMLSNAQSDYLAWFATSQYQKRIQEEWTSLDQELKSVIQSFLFDFLQQHFGSGTGPGSGSGSGSALGTEIGAEWRLDVISADGTGGGAEAAPGTINSAPRFSPFVLNKVVQLITDIALLDWPDRFQGLFPHIHRLLQSKNKNHSLLGWTLLEAVVQEFVGTYPALGSGKSHRHHSTLSQQRRYLWEQFKAHAPDLLNLIVQHLDTCYSKMLIMPLSTEAPAPSPVEHSLWGMSSSRRPSAAGPYLTSPLTQMNSSFQNSFTSSRTVPGSTSSSAMGMSLQGGDVSPVQSYGKSPTTMLRKSLGQALGGPINENGVHLSLTQSSTGPGFSILQTRQRVGSISDLGQIAMRRSSINAAGRRGSVDSTTFISGSKMDSYSRKSCMLALQALTTLLTCPGLDPRQVSFSASITAILKFTTLHQNKTVDLGILALSCLNGLVARPGFLATNQEAMTGAVRVMADLIRYFNEVGDGIDDVDESYLQMFMHFLSLFCTLVNLDRAEKALGLSKADFLMSFARFTLEKVSVDYLKVCMDVWKGLLDSMIHAASDIPRPIPPQDGLRRLQGPLFYFMSALVERFYQMKGATESEDAFSTFEVEDEEDLDDLTDLVESFVGLVAEIFTEEVIEMLIPLLTQQLELYSRREIDKCKTLPVTLGILSRVTYNFDRNFEDRRDYISNLVIHLVRMTNMSIDYYLATTGDTTGPAKGKEELTGTITLALFNCLSPLTSWLNQLWKVEMAPDSNDKTQTRTPIAREIYQEYAHLCASLFQRLLPTSSLGSLSQSAAPLSSSGPVNAFLGPATISCSTMDRKLLLTSVKTLEMLTLQVRIPSNLLSTGELLPWDLESVRGMGSCLSQNVMHCSSFMGLEFNTSSKDMLKGGGSDRADEEEEQDRKDITPDDELFMLAYLTLSNFITLDPKTGPELQSAALQAFGTLVAPIVYPLQSILQEARSSQGNHLSNPEVKFRVHRCLTILRTLIKSVNEASVASRTLVYEGLKSALPLIQEFFEAYIDDHDISMNILKFFRELIRSLYRQIGMSQCMEIARVLMERSTNPSLLENALSSTPSQQHISPSGNPQQQALHQQSFVLHQRKIIQRIQLSVSILRIILELPGKEISQSLPSFIQFLFVQLGPKLFEAQQQGPQHPTGLGSNRVNQESSIDNGVYDLITVFFSTIQTLLTHHTRFFFASNGTNNLQASQTLQGCMEYLARGLHRQEPDIVRQSIEILCALQDHSLCHLFDRVEFQTAYRFEFLQILLRLALSHEHDLLLEDIAGLIHKLVKKGDRDPEDKFMTIWHVDLKRFVAALKPSQVKVMPVATSTFMSGSASPLSVPSLSVSPTPHSPHSPQTQTGGASRPFPDEVKEALWKDLMNLGDGSLYREALYEFVNDAQVYAQNLLVHP